MVSISTAPVARPPAEIYAASELSVCLKRSTAFRRRLCPRQVLGVRIGLHAGELLELELPRQDKRLFIFVETDGCFTDGVSAVTGCWLGRRTMRLVDHGKVAATIVDTHTGRAIRIWPDQSARLRAIEYAPEAETRWQAQLLGYQRMPTSKLLRAEPVRIDLPLAAIISQPGLRVACVACGEEIMNGREVVVGGRQLCRACAGERYCTPIPQSS